MGTWALSAGDYRQLIDSRHPLRAGGPTNQSVAPPMNTLEKVPKRHAGPDPGLRRLGSQAAGQHLVHNDA